jgi:hypothetical protein
VPHGVKEDFDVRRQVDSDDWRVTKDLYHGQEGPEVHHLTIQPEGNVQLDNDQNQENNSLATSSGFKRFFVDILWQLSPQDTHEVSPLFTNLLHHFTSFCDKEFRLLDFDLGLV